MDAPLSKTDLSDTIVDRFQDVVRAFPNRTAVVDRQGSYSYTQLDELSNGIARALSRMDTPSQFPVLIWLPAGRYYVASVIGVLKAGRFYTSLNPVQPDSRTARVMKDSNSVVALTDALGKTALRRFNLELQLLTVDAVTSATSCDRGSASAEDPYCIYFTSGSTGEPKGVVHAHKNLLAHIRNYTRALTITEVDRLSLLASPNFAASASDVFGALLNGACVLPFDLLGNGLNKLIDWIEQEQITVYHTTPSLFRVVAGGISDPRKVESIRIVKLGGEAVRHSDLQLLDRRFSEGTILVNGLGITEAAGNIAYCRYPGSPYDRSRAVPVGYAVEDKRIEILDAQGNRAAGGEGEIAVTGENLALGYWNDPELTARRFRRNPEDGTTTFRTGDTGILQKDGCLIHCGRTDRLLKIRGYRVYPEEIEQCVMDLDGVAACVVVATKRNHTALSLAIFVVLSDRSSLSREQVRRHMRDNLPAYIVPACIQVLEHFPMLPNGKIDQKTLRVLAENRIEPDDGQATLVPASTPTEQQLVKIWEDVFKCSPLGAGHNFFALGGDSLMAISTLAEIERRFRRRIAPEVLVRNPTIAQLASILDERLSGRNDAPHTAAPAVNVFHLGSGNGTALFGVHGAGGTVCFANLARYLKPDQPFYVLQGKGLDSSPLPFRDVIHLAQCYVDTILDLRGDGPYCICGRWSPIVIEVAQQLLDSGREVALTMVFENVAPTVPTQPTWMHRIALRHFHGALKHLWPAKMPGTNPADNGSEADTQAGSTIGPPTPRKINNLLIAEYAPRKKIPGTVVLYRSHSFAQKESKLRHVSTWRALTDDLDIHVLPVHHKDMWRYPGIQTLAHAVQDRIDAVRGRGPVSHPSSYA